MESLPGLGLLFGSEARARVLAVLANAKGPLSGYRISQLSNVQPIKVSQELQRMREAGLVQGQPKEGRGNEWVLLDADLRSFLAKRVRVSWSEDWFNARSAVKSSRSAQELRERINRLPAPELSKYTWTTGPPALLRDFERTPGKDRVLRKLGLPTSRRQHVRASHLRKGER